jgi:hypothetical protein
MTPRPWLGLIAIIVGGVLVLMLVYSPLPETGEGMTVDGLREALRGVVLTRALGVVSLMVGSYLFFDKARRS